MHVIPGGLKYTGELIKSKFLYNLHINDMRAVAIFSVACITENMQSFDVLHKQLKDRFSHKSSIIFRYWKRNDNKLQLVGRGPKKYNDCSNALFLVSLILNMRKCQNETMLNDAVATKLKTKKI